MFWIGSLKDAFQTSSKLGEGVEDGNEDIELMHLTRMIKFFPAVKFRD